MNKERFTSAGLEPVNVASSPPTEPSGHYVGGLLILSVSVPLVVYLIVRNYTSYFLYHLYHLDRALQSSLAVCHQHVKRTSTKLFVHLSRTHEQIFILSEDAGTSEGLMSYKLTNCLLDYQLNS